MRKWSTLLFVLVLGLLAQDRPPKPVGMEFHITGQSIERQPDGSLKIVGNAVVETKLLTISADEMVYDEGAREIKPRGNVRVKFSSEPK